MIGSALDVVLVADLADDLLEHVLDGHQAGGAAVLVDDDRHLHLPALHLLEQLGHALALGHEVRRPHQRRHRIGVAPPARQHQQVLDEDDADDVVEVVAVDRDARVLLLAEQRAQLAERRVGADRDDVGPRRHDLADHVSVKSTIDCSSSRLSSLSSCSASRRLGWSSPAALAASAPSRRRGRSASRRAHRRPSSASGQRQQRARQRAERRQQDVEHPLGIARGRSASAAGARRPRRTRPARRAARRSTSASLHVAEPRDQHAGEHGRCRSACAPG